MKTLELQYYFSTAHLYRRYSTASLLLVHLSHFSFSLPSACLDHLLSTEEM